MPRCLLCTEINETFTFQPPPYSGWIIQGLANSNDDGPNRGTSLEKINGHEKKKSEPQFTRALPTVNIMTNRAKTVKFPRPLDCGKNPTSGPNLSLNIAKFDRSSAGSEVHLLKQLRHKACIAGAFKRSAIQRSQSDIPFHCWTPQKLHKPYEKSSSRPENVILRMSLFI